MKVLSYILAAAGAFLFIYAAVCRFIGDASVFGYIFPLEAKTVVLGANTFLLLAILAVLYQKK